MGKRLLIWSVVGLAIGDAVGVLLGVRVLSYWYRPPGITDQDRCVAQIDAALLDLAKFQGIAAAIGLLLFLILGVFWHRGRRPAAPQGGVPASGKGSTPTV